MLISSKEIRHFFLKNGYLLIGAAWLITLAFLFNNYWLYISSPTAVQRSLEKNIQQREKEFYKLVSNDALMQQLLNRNYDQATLNKLTGNKKDFYLFFYKGDWETFWTTDEIAYDSAITHLPEGVHFRRLQSGYYEIIRKNLGGDNFVLGFLPVKKQYYFTNPYLSNNYYQLPRITNQYVVNINGPGLAINSTTGQKLFSLQFLPDPENHNSSWLGGVLLALAIIAVLIFINQFALYIGQEKDPLWGFIFLCAVIFVFRFLSYIMPFPFDYEQYRLFDATIYASNLILRSLGDLLIDVALIAWIIIYAYSQLKEKFRFPVMSVYWRCGLMGLISLATFYTGLLAAGIIKGLVINSKISFDVTNFFSLSIYTVAGFVILGLLGFCFFFLSLIINRLLNELSEENNVLKYIVLAISGFIWLGLQLLHTSQPYTLGVMIWVVFYFYLLDVSGQRMGKELNLQQFIFWLVILTISATAIMVYYNSQREIANRKQLAIKLSKQKDPTLEINLGIIDTSLLKDPVVITYFRTEQKKGKNELTDHLLNEYFANLQNKYEFSFYTFDDSGNVLGTADTTSLQAVRQRLISEAEPTSVRNLFYQEQGFTSYNYTAVLPVLDPQKGFFLGYLFYQIEPKTVKPETLYPELLMKAEDNRFENALSNYSYAVYDHLDLVYNRNSYPFPLQLSMKDIPLGEFNYTKENGYSILRYQPTQNKIVVMVKENRNVIEAITLFAYMFCIFLLLILLLRGAQLLIKARMRPKVIQEMVNLNIRTRVHAIIIFIVVFSFVILGISTIKFFTNRYDQQHRKKLDNEINSVLVNVENVFSKNFSSDGVMHFYDLSFQTHIKNAIQDIADMYGVDINIYDLDGNLGISTQSLIYKNGLLSHKMDPKAYYKLHTLHQIQVIQKEQIGSLNFLSSYVPVRNTEGQVMAFLNQPYYASQTDLKQEISNFLVTLINLNAFIFLLSGLLALLFTNSITRSFTLISEKLRHVNLSGKNEEIVWKHHDEIGKLVKEYNIMVHKLEESAAMLAKSEREGAWREMARQVAHEIKNPLTPMKLSLQHLQRAIRDDSPKKQKLTEDVSKTLIEQIEHLSQIASDFSAFANIAYASKEKILLNNILSSVTTLHKGYEKVKVQYQKPQEPYYVYADKTQMNRLFTNLVQNAMQAISDGQKGMVTVSTEREDDHVIVKVKDDGTGIPDELKDKIFTPNFTTKSSGTGLGLAICKNIVQQAEGDIWFDTRKDKGTVFYVKLPLMEQ